MKTKRSLHSGKFQHGLGWAELEEESAPAPLPARWTFGAWFWHRGAGVYGLSVLGASKSGHGSIMVETTVEPSMLRDLLGKNHFFLSLDLIAERLEQKRTES